MAASRGWDSHIWNDQTTMRLMRADQGLVEIRSSERMPASFMVPRAVLYYFCPRIQPPLDGHPIILETSRAVIQLFFGWVYTGKLDTASWHDTTELYFLGHSLRSVALMRSAVSQMQRACRDDAKDDTELFHYGHIRVIDEMVSTQSPLFHYVEDTYFNHWHPSDDVDVNDSPEEHQNLDLFFKRLYERSFRQQREGSNCSCCHDYCKYHGHESEAERLATCGRFDVPMSTSTQQESPTPTTRPEAVGRRARKSKARVRKSLPNQELMSESDDYLLHETRVSSRAETLSRSKGSASSWLKVRSHAPVDYPADYHGRLTSLPLVNSIKIPNWLEIGLEAEGVEQLQEPDRIIAAAMAWTAEEYAQTKCVFFDQYATAMQPGTEKETMDHWRNTLKFGGSKPKERADRLLAMWECLGWLEETSFRRDDTHPTMDASAQSDASHPGPVSTTHIASPRVCFGGNVLWSAEEREAMGIVMRTFEADEAYKNVGLLERARMCSERLKTQYGHNRTPRAIHHQWEKTQAPTGTSHTLVDNSQAADSEGDNGRGRSWTDHEDKALMDVMRDIETNQMYTAIAKTRKRWDVCSQRLLAEHNIMRTPAACCGRCWKRNHERAHQSQVSSSQDQHLDEGSVSDPTTNNRSAMDNDNDDSIAKKKASVAWSSEEEDTMFKLMTEIHDDPAFANSTSQKKFETCIQRLKSEYGTDRTCNSIAIRYNARVRLEKEIANRPKKGEVAPQVTLNDNPPYKSSPVDSSLGKNINSTSPGMSMSAGRKIEYWTAAEDKAMLKLLTEVEADPSLQYATEIERFEVCSQRLKSGYGAERTPNGIKKRLRTLQNKRDAVAERKRVYDDGDGDEDFQDSQPLSRSKRSKVTKSRFVDELFRDDDFKDW